jgi:hypothetical protein
MSFCPESENVYMITIATKPHPILDVLKKKVGYLSIWS